jgi:type I restriction enzyme M protein
MTTNISETKNGLCGAADQLWANSGLAPREHLRPVLGLMFLRYVEHKFVLTEGELLAQKKAQHKEIRKLDFQTVGTILRS